MSFFTERWNDQSNSSSVFRYGSRAALMRASPPWLSRLDCSVERRASAKRSKVHSSLRARSASLGRARAAAGALSARKRWPSSEVAAGALTPG